MNKRKAFSLIELMVVIAIVAILAVVALPAYKLYILKTKLNMANSFGQSQVDASIRYYNANGVFANLQQVGLPYDPASPSQSLTPASTDDYVQKNIAMMTLDDSSTPSCKAGNSVLYISDLGDGAFPDSNADLVMITNVFADVDGIIVKRCVYNYYQGGFSGTAISGSYVSNCENILDNPAAYAEVTTLLNTCTY